MQWAVPWPSSAFGCDWGRPVHFRTSLCLLGSISPKRATAPCQVRRCAPRLAVKALAPRLLCAFGSQRDRWENADSLAAFSGIAPVTKRSGKQCQVHRRFACPKYLRQTFHEFANSARLYCPWSKARYRMLRDRGMKHHAALRKIARSWIRILFRVWQTRVPFDCDRYIARLKQRCPEITQYLIEEN